MCKEKSCIEGAHAVQESTGYAHYLWCRKPGETGARYHIDICRLVAELEIKVERGGGMAAATVAATVQLVRHNAEGSVMTFTE